MLALLWPLDDIVKEIYLSSEWVEGHDLKNCVDNYERLGCKENETTNLKAKSKLNSERLLSLAPTLTRILPKKTQPIPRYNLTAIIANNLRTQPSASMWCFS